MEKIIVIGCPGSGKSTFSRALHAAIGLPLCHLDMLFWNADRTTVPRPVFLERLEATLAQERWIIDGDYASTMELRLKACDTVFFLDLSLDECIVGLAKRHGRPRPDLPWVEGSDPEEDAKFREYVRAYASERRPATLALLERYPSKTVITFRSREEVNAYLRALSLADSPLSYAEC